MLAGGFGSAVLEELNRQGLDTPVLRIGWPDQFIEHGKPDDAAQEVRTDRGSGAGRNSGSTLGIPV